MLMPDLGWPYTDTFLDGNLLGSLKPEFASPSNHVDRPLSNSRSLTRCLGNEELLPFTNWWSSRHAPVGQLMRIWISCLYEAGHCACVCIVGEAVGSLNSINRVPLCHQYQYVLSDFLTGSKMERR